MLSSHPALRWGLHVVAYLVVLLGLLGLVDRDDGWNFDDGAYAIQVQVLRADPPAEPGDQQPAWAYPYQQRDRDPASRFAPVSHSTTTSEGTFPYVKQPAWIEVLRASAAAADRVADPTWGLYLPGVVGAAVAALVAGLLAERLVPGRSGVGPAAFWAVALGPLVLQTHAIWAHTTAAALGGIAALGLAALAGGRGGRWPVAGMAIPVALMALLRTEAALFALALASVAFVVGERRARELEAPRRRSLLAGLGVAAPVLGAAVVGRLVSTRWMLSLAPGGEVDGPNDAGPQFGLLAGRVNGLLRTFVDGMGTSAAGTMLALVAAALAVLAGRAARRRGSHPAEALALLGAAVVLLVVRVLVAPDDLAGFVAAAPVVVAGLAAWRWKEAPVAERALVALVALHAAAVLATQYPEGGSRDWGGRFLFPVLVPASVVAIATLWRLLVVGARPGEEPVATVRAGLAGPILAALVLAAAVPTAAGLRSTDSLRASNRALTDLTLSTDAPTVIRIPRYLTRTSWRALPGPDWLSAEVDTADDALALLRPGRTDPVAVVGDGADQVRAPGYDRDVRSPALVVFTPS